MTIDKTLNGSKLTLKLSGRLDTTTAPQLEGELHASLNEDVKELSLDFTDIAYVSSAGLRVLLAAQKRMARQGEMKLTGVSDAVMEVFEMTGFTDILTIE